MTLQPPQPIIKKNRPAILCYRCGATIVFDKDHISPTTKWKIPLDPFFNNQPHAQYCMYATSRQDPSVDSILSEFISIVKAPKQKKVLFAVGKARD